MPFVKIAGETGNYKKPIDWDESRDGACGDLSVRKDSYGRYTQFNFAWKPTPAELAAITAGGQIEVHIINNYMPPVGVTVTHCAERKTVTINEEAFGHDEHGISTP